MFVGLRLAQYGLLFGCGLISARELGPAGRAAYALPLALGSSVWLLSHLSIDIAAARVYARRETGLYELVRMRVTTVIALGLADFAAALLIAFTVIRSLLGHASPIGIVLGALTAPLWLGVSAGGGILLLIGRTRAYAIWGVLSALVQLVLLLALIVAGRLTPEGAMATVAAGLLINMIAFGALVADSIGLSALRPSQDWPLLLRLIRIGGLIHPAAVALALSLQVDLFCISALGSRNQVGHYSVAATLAGSVFLAVTALAQAAFHDQMQPDEGKAAAYTARFMRRSTILAGMLAILGVALGYPLIRFVYGPTWTASVVPFMILTAASIPLMIQTPAMVFLYRSARPVIFALAGVGAVAVNVVLNLVLIPPLGIIGCALASFITYSAYAFVLLTQYRRVTGSPIRSLFFGRA